MLPPFPPLDPEHGPAHGEIQRLLPEEMAEEGDLEPLPPSIVHDSLSPRRCLPLLRDPAPPLGIVDVEVDEPRMPLPQYPQHLARQPPIPFLPLPSLMASSLLCTGQWHGGDERGTKSMYSVFFAQVLLLDLRGLPLLPSELIIRQI